MKEFRCDRIPASLFSSCFCNACVCAASFTIGDLCPTPCVSSPLSAMLLGNINQLSTLPAICQTRAATVQHMMDVKPVVSFPFDVPSPIRFFPNINARAVVSHMLGIPLPPNKRHINSCNICQLCFNSQSQAEAHYKGNKHARMVKGLVSNKMKQKGLAPRDSTNSTVSRTTYTLPTDITAKNINTAAVGMEIVSTAVDPEPLPPVQSLLPPEPQLSTSLIAPTDSTSPTVAISTGDTKVDGVTAIDAGIVNSQSLVETAKKLLYCSLCKVGVNSLSQLGAHNSGTKHKMMMAARNGSGPIKAYPKPHFKLSGQSKPCSGLQDKIFHCQLCDVRVNSEVQLKQHISSRRHKDRAAGKPPKPKLSPLNKQQLNVATSAMLLPLQNEFQESIAARFLPNSLAATMTTASPSLSLRPAAAPTIFQAPQMVQHLLRPAPGPIRASHGPILFTPY